MLDSCCLERKVLPPSVPWLVWCQKPKVFLCQSETKVYSLHCWANCQNLFRVRHLRHCKARRSASKAVTTWDSVHWIPHRGAVWKKMDFDENSRNFCKHHVTVESTPWVFWGGPNHESLSPSPTQNSSDSTGTEWGFVFSSPVQLASTNICSMSEGTQKSAISVSWSLSVWQQPGIINASTQSIHWP